MTAPGPAELGRAVLVGPGQAAPAPWAGAERLVLDGVAIDQPAVLVRRLHAAWASREPVVVELQADPALVRAPVAWSEPLWQLGPDLEPWADRLHFLLWANAYDARAEGPPVWWWARKAVRLGATEVDDDGPGDVVLPDGTRAWVDGGPRSPLPVPLAGAAVVHSESVELGRLVPQPAPVAPGAELATDQLESVGHGSGPARIVAPAGSGKTRVLTERLRHLLADRGYEREATLALAYNKKAQEEMAARLPGLGARIQTLNAWGYGLLARAWGRRPDLLDEREVRAIVERLVPSQRRRVNTDPIAPYLDGLSLIRLGLRDPEEVEASLDDVPGLAAAYEPYRAELRRRGAIDFDEQVFGAAEALLRDGELRRGVQAAHRHLLVDELQDLTPAHVLLVRLASAPAFDVFAVGDDDQCQPPGTKVSTDRGLVPIEQLDPARDELVSWDRSSTCFIGGTGTPYARARRTHQFSIAGRQYEGDLISIHAGDAQTQVTPDHLCLARFSEEAWSSGPKVVYLMRRGGWWRIGKCSLRHGNTLGPGLRMRAERADAVWILDVFADAREALAVEAVTAANFGLPMTTFEPVAAGGVRTDRRSIADITRVFSQIEDADAKAEAVLEAFGRDPRFPFWSKGAVRGGRVTMLLRASNLLSDWMTVPVQVPHTKREVAWVTAKLDRSPYSGPVYSLSVEPLKTYVADGIVVHNCIYGHAGADPRFLIDYDGFFPGAGHHALEVNYRCPAAVTEAAANLLGYNDRRVPKEIRPGPQAAPGAEALEVRTHASDAGAAALVGTVEGWLAEPGVDPTSVAVLARVQSLLLAPHVALAEAGVPVDSILDEGVLTRLGLRAALAYLRIAVDPERVDGRDLSEVHRRPSRGLPQWATKFLDRCRSVEDVRRAAGRIDDARVADKLEDLATDLERLAGAARRGATTRDLLTAVRDDIGLGSAMTLLDSSGAAAASHLDDLEALLQVADLHPDASTFEGWLRRTFHRERAEGGVVLSTIHRVKGLEWDRVVVFGATDGIVPHRLAEDVEEERRVLHVGITRGRDRVAVLGDAARPSPFLAELDGSAPRGAVRASRAKRVEDPVERPRPAGPTSVPAAEGLELAVLGGYSGTVAEVGDAGVRLALEGGGTLEVRFGERVRVDGELRTLGRPASPVAARAGAALRAWRTERARADKVPPYVVLNDKHLDGIAERHPTDLAALRSCPGIGPAKLDAYGEEILAVLAGAARGDEG